MSHKLEIYGTLGPACCKKEVLISMLKSGMTGIRLNLSHRSLAQSEEWLNTFYEVCDHYRLVPDLLVDLQGPELRIGSLELPVELKPGDAITFANIEEVGALKKGTDKETIPAYLSASDTEEISGKKESSYPVIPVPAPLFESLKGGQSVRMDDGKIAVEISREDPHLAYVQKGGILQSKKSILIDGLSIDLPTLTKEDLENISHLKEYRVTGVMLPFVRGRDDLIALRKALLDQGLSHIRIFAKIENMQGVRKLPELLPHCDQIVIARGDLGNAVPLSTLPGLQKEISMVCKRAKVPFMVVTQMLASMEHAPVPTRAEVSDIFNAVIDGASAIMLTGETAAGEYPEEAMKVMCDTAYEAQDFLKRPGLHYIIM